MIGASQSNPHINHTYKKIAILRPDITFLESGGSNLSGKKINGCGQTYAL